MVIPKGQTIPEGFGEIRDDLKEAVSAQRFGGT
jgi:hypothetical protein